MSVVRGGLGRNLLPDGYTPYKRTPTFSAESVPAGLLQAHNTKAGVWGVITVERGCLGYTIENDPSVELIVDPAIDAVVAPEEKHHVAIIASDTLFHVTFYRAPTAS